MNRAEGNSGCCRLTGVGWTSPGISFRSNPPSVWTIIRSCGAVVPAGALPKLQPETHCARISAKSGELESRTDTLTVWVEGSCRRSRTAHAGPPDQVGLGPAVSVESTRIWVLASKPEAMTAAESAASPRIDFDRREGMPTISIAMILQGKPQGPRWWCAAIWRCWGI